MHRQPMVMGGRIPPVLCNLRRWDWHHAYNFDALTGEKLHLEQVIPLIPNKKNAVSEDQYPSEQYTERLVARMTKLYTAQMTDVRNSYCDYTDVQAWNYASWYFTDSGIQLKPFFKHFYMECGDETWSVVPYKNVSPRLRLDGKRKVVGKGVKQ